MVTVITQANVDGSFGSMKKYTVDNGDGYAFSCINFGATLTSLTMPDKKGQASDILLHFESAESIYKDQTYFFGKAIGRVGGRIKDASVFINGTDFQLPGNEHGNTLHGGPNGFHHLWWDGKIVDNGIQFSRTIQTEDDGFPGSLNVSITYKWGENHRFMILLHGTNDSNQDTLFNPTVHSYFNLNNDKTLGLANHELLIHSEQIVATNDQLIPTGKLLPVSGTVFDFSSYRAVAPILASVPSDGFTGYDHPFKVSGPLIGSLKNSENGRRVDLFSNRNGLIFYSLNSIGEPVYVNDHLPLKPFMGAALEPQTLPDAVHHPDFGHIILAKQQEKSYQIIYELSVDQ